MVSLTWEALRRFAGLGSSPTYEDSAIPGYVGGRQLMKRLSAVWWGATAGDPHGHINGLPVKRGSPIYRAIVDGQLHECAHVVVSAASAGNIRGVVSIDGEKKEIQPSEWGERTTREWRYDLLNGRVMRTEGEPTAWASDHMLMFEEAAVTAWLKSLSSPHLLPSPLKRESKHLRDDLVTVSQAVIWLSEGFSEDWLRLVGPSDHETNTAIAHLEDSSIDPIVPSIWLASYLAHTKRKIDVERIILASLRNQKIIAYGISVLGSRAQRAGEAEIIEIPQDQFKVARQLMLANSSICVDHEADVNAESETTPQGNWAHVRFNRSELIRLWGDVDVRDETASA